MPGAKRHIISILALPVVVVIVIPALLSSIFSVALFTSSELKYLGFLLFLPGLALFIWTQFLFDQKGQGTLAPWDATIKLVTSGPYKYSRNPMITSVLMMLVGEAVYFRSVAILLWAVFFFSINTLYFKYKEEVDLEKKFGEDYKTYKKKVRRWL